MMSILMLMAEDSVISSDITGPDMMTTGRKNTMR